MRRIEPVPRDAVPTSLLITWAAGTLLAVTAGVLIGHHIDKRRNSHA